MLESYIVGHSSYSSCLGQYRTQSRLLGILQVITFKWRRVMYVGHLVILRPILNTKPAMRTFPPASILPLWPPACLPSSTIVVKIQRCHVFVSHEWSYALSEPIDMIWYCMHIFTQSSQKKTNSPYSPLLSWPTSNKERVTFSTLPSSPSDIWGSFKCWIRFRENQ